MFSEGSADGTTFNGGRAAMTLEPSKCAQNGPCPWMPTVAPRGVFSTATGTAAGSYVKPSALHS